MIERERTFLLKYVPTDLQNFSKKEIFDLYIPEEAEHPVLRIRKAGDEMVITKKFDVDNSVYAREEVTIPLTKHEYRGFLQIPSKKVTKVRYDYPYKGRMAEIDLFQQDLYGLALVDFEFEDEENMLQFQMPDFCLVEVTEEDALAGGVLAGRKYQDLKPMLEKYGYKPLLF